jgi:hypothetical protein
MQFFASTEAAAERAEYRPVRSPLGLRTLIVFALWFGGALTITELVANALRASHISQRATSEYHPPSTPPTFYRRGPGADGR